MAEVIDGHPPRTTVELVHQASEQIGRLVRAEIALAKAELAEKGRQAALGAVLLAAAGILGLFGAAALVATLILALALVLPPWEAAAAVTAGLLAVAAALALLARGRLARMRAARPVVALTGARADVDEIRHALADRDPRTAGVFARPANKVSRPHVDKVSGRGAA